ncbi:hypothetical protein ASD77_00545 [Pseudoxanthomonas sp. Root65]|uniref:hypothetical protein n=1 Tax=Pseudoxanthomonas sp. Root65 TaxID=1736576 RepID=UPI0006F7FF17|nr:hypothetical protein [Pseudoxanthomonas sp. Root65]KRA53225.1 hypothetical protein ASD77_00545 [Pseudoxanthomonas sp. Root65]
MPLLNTVIPSPSTVPPPFDDARVQLLRSLLADRDWSQASVLRQPLQQALALLSAPGGGALDEATWLLVADETARYLDFRRLRNLEAQLRGCPPEALQYTRADWEAARMAEAALESHLRQVRLGSYAPEAVPMFRIH